MKRHKWVKKGKKPWVYWECSKCGCSKQKDYVMPWYYFLPDRELPRIKAPACIATEGGGE